MKIEFAYGFSKTVRTPLEALKEMRDSCVQSDPPRVFAISGGITEPQPEVFCCRFAEPSAVHESKRLFVATVWGTYTELVKLCRLTTHIG